MNAFEGVLDDLNKSNFEFLENGFKSFDTLIQNVNNYFSRINDVVEEYKISGIVPSLDGWEHWEDVANQKSTENLKKSTERNSLKENIEPPQEKNDKQVSPPRGRPRRNAFKEASHNINKQSTTSLSTKSRRPTNLEENLSSLKVKTEKLSLCSSDDNKTFSSLNQEAVNVKMEQEEMPAPSRPAPRKKKRKGESTVRIKQEKRDSDVIIQDATLTIINLDLSDGEKTLKNTTSSKSIQKKTKRSRTNSSEEEEKANTEKKSKSNDMPNYAEYLRAASSEAQNTTFVSKPADSAQQQNMNVTITVEKPKYVTNLVPKSVEDMMTDDESEEEVKKKNPVKPIRGIPKPTKQIFSLFEQSPVKTKVQAFEKLRDEANAIPVRITRTKTRARAKEQENIDGEESTETEAKSNVKEKAKMFTPAFSRFNPKGTSTTVKTNNRVLASNSNESLLSAKSASALKASQAEYREREKKRREKEQEALKKREALLQAQIEEKKRKREEKQLKAQQHREQLEKEKLKVLEIQRQKDERHKQFIAEQEEKKIKQKEEQEKKRLMAKMRAVEEKKREEAKRLEEEKKAEEMTAKLARQDEDMARMLQKQKQKPIYMTTKTPLLPTGDCYDSDDEEHHNNYVVPQWGKEQNLKFMQKCAFAAGEAIKNTFFSIQAQTPDLEDIFEVIEPQKLKRTSSAVWHKPPRFTMLPTTMKNFDETEEFDDDQSD